MPYKLPIMAKANVDPTRVDKFNQFTSKWVSSSCVCLITGQISQISYSY